MEPAYIQDSEHLKVNNSFFAAYRALGYDKQKEGLQFKDVIDIARKMGYSVSPSQAVEGLFFAKGDVNKFKDKFEEKELEKLVKWFYDKRKILRLVKRNYLKVKRKLYNNSVNMRPSVNMINTGSLADHTPVRTPFSPNKTGFSQTERFNDDESIRSKIRGTMKDLEKLPKIK